MKKLFGFLFVFAGCLFISCSEITSSEVLTPDEVPPPEVRNGEEVNGEEHTNIKCNNTPINQDDICIITNSLSSSDKELFSDLVEKVFQKNVIYQEVN